MRQPIRILPRCLAVLVWAGLLWSSAGAAHAVTLSAPAQTTLTVDVQVTLMDNEPSGTVLLVRDGFVVSRRPVAAGGSVEFTDVPVSPGEHRFRATLQHATGFAHARRAVTVTAWGIPASPVWIAPGSGYATNPCAIRVKAGASTTSMTLTYNGTVIGTRVCRPGELVAFGSVAVPKGTSTYSILAENPFGQTATYTVSAKRLEYPYATCIIIDKSDYRLYWIRNGSLVKTYPIAHGKNNCTPVATWKILAKYKTTPGSVYGPRKMRMFRKVGKKFVFTAYAIHGTNQEWVIGTQASHGCIRMYNRDVLELWPQVPIGTMVITRP